MKPRWRLTAGGLIRVAIVPGDFALTIGFTGDGQAWIGWPAEASG